MDNKIKRYLDMVLDHLVRGTKIDYENERIYPSSLLPISFPLFLPPSFSPLSPSSSSYSSSLSDYCRNQFGLTDEEIEYVWNEFKEIIKDKISKRES